MTTCESHARWSREAFDGLCGHHEELSSSRIHSRAFAGWMRSFVSDMVALAHLHPRKVIPTARIVRILSAKTKFACLTADEFDSCTRAIAYPSPNVDVDFEAEFVWSLFDTSRSGKISQEKFVRLRALWEELGLADQDKELDGLETVTAEQYYTWLALCQLDAKTLELPPRAATAPSGARRKSALPGMKCAQPLKPQDHVLRSSEIAQLALADRSPRPGLARTLAPSRFSKKKLPKGTYENSEISPNQVESVVSARLPAVKRIDWKSQQELWSWRDHRLVPYMSVKSAYKKPDGSKSEAFGTLLTGWGIPNKSTTIPHSFAPEGARLGDARRAIEAKSLQRTACIGSDDSAEHCPEPWLEEVERWRNADRNVVVRINGIDRLVPREWVTPVSSAHSHSTEKHSL